ncbi:MAG: hypothetical protein AAGM04_09815 [Pseudomonadota bacterium]
MLSALILASLHSVGLWAQAAALEPMTKAQIEENLFGRTLNGEYANGLAWTERLNTDGSSTYVENGKAISGNMRFEGNLLCFRYPGVPSSSGGCFEVWRRSINCFDFYGTEPNTSFDVPLSARRFGQSWTARAWYADQQGTCTTEQIS